MTGRYKLLFPDMKWFGAKARDEHHAQNWSRFMAVCRSLDRDGLSYDVQFNLAGDSPHVLITASGPPVPHKRSGSATRALTLPAPITSERCREHALEAEWFLTENAGRRNNQTTHWRRRYTRYQELAGMADDTLRAEVEFWREMELLSGRRQHFKPGRTDESIKADDEVAA